MLSVLCKDSKGSTALTQTDKGCGLEHHGFMQQLIKEFKYVNCRACFGFILVVVNGG